MAYFTWKETGLTADCSSLEAMASRFEEAGVLMRGLARQGFVLEKHLGVQRISHPDSSLFEAYGFVNEEPSERQLTFLA